VAARVSDKAVINKVGRIRLVSVDKRRKLFAAKV
jgi:hypothetical protein